MENSIYIALSRRNALQRQMDVVAHNLANMNTPAFKAERIVFREFLVDPGNDVPSLSFVQDVGQYKVRDDGPMQQTGNDFDVAISGDGYFVLDGELGQRYTRHGRFTLNEAGLLVTSSGDPVVGDGGAIQIPPGETDISITKDGVISGSNGRIAQLRIVTFENEQELRRAANGQFTTLQDAQDVENPTVIQGSLEGSNVQAVLELTNMMELSRRHQSLKRFIDKEDRRQTDMIDKLGRPSA